jgi:hypothetical protein
MNIATLPKSLYYFLKTSGPTTQAGIFFQICQVGGLAIIHKWNEPNLARGQTVK